MSKQQPLGFQTILFVALGGIAGSLLRWAFSLWLPNTGFPFGTLLVNYLGAGILMGLVVFANHHPAIKWWWRPLLGSGFCGGFTTYSAFAVKVESYIQAKDFHAAIGYMAASILGTYLIVIAIHNLSMHWLKKAGHA